MTLVLRFSYTILTAIAIGPLCGCELYFGDDHERDDAAQAVALPPHEPPPDECLGFGCPGAIDAGVGVDADIGADIDAATATHPPLPQPDPCSTCVGFSCDTVCADAGVDAP